MGLLGGRGRGRGRGAVARGRGATTWVAAGVAPLTPLVGRGAPRGRAAMMAVRSLDRRPKVLEVTGFEKEEKEELELHLQVMSF